MSKGQDKRQVIFDAYKGNLNLLIDHGFISHERDVYVCPICLRSHTDLNSDDPLTLEDAPPKSLGGTSNTLTCKSCNNTAGYNIDFHLVERLRELDNAKFLPNSETLVKVKIGNKVLQGKVIVDELGSLKMYHALEQNHPGKLEAAMQEVKSGDPLDIDFIKRRVIPENLEYALLKTGYILLFRIFGYSLVLDSCYDIVRQQLLNPSNRVYPEGFWFSPNISKDLSGVYFVCDEGLECMLALFNLNTGRSERMFGVFLPLCINPIHKVIFSLNEKLEKEKNFPVTLYPLEQVEMNYLSNVENIKAMYNWIEKRKSKNH